MGHVVINEFLIDQPCQPDRKGAGGSATNKRQMRCMFFPAIFCC